MLFQNKVTQNKERTQSSKKSNEYENTKECPGAFEFSRIGIV
jgi:hypothetical protein